MLTIADAGQARLVTGGVDTHAEVHVAGMAGQAGRVLGTREFPADAAGYQAALAWMRGHGDLVKVGVEGIGSYGAGLARYLAADETMIVLAGEILMHLDGEEHTVRAGGIASAPRGIPHAFMVSGADGARLLCLHTPGCCQAFYWDASEPVPDGDSRAIAAGPVDMGRVQASAQKNGGIEILGPPPFSQVTQD